MRPIFPVMKNQVVHRAAANADHRRPTSLTFQRDQTKCLLHARVNKKIGGSIITSKLARLGAISDPGNVLASCLKFAELISLRTIADHKEMKFIRPPSL